MLMLSGPCDEFENEWKRMSKRGEEEEGKEEGGITGRGRDRPTADRLLPAERWRR